jgi:hypothetical protein
MFQTTFFATNETAESEGSTEPFSKRYNKHKNNTIISKAVKNKKTACARAAPGRTG